MKLLSLVLSLYIFSLVTAPVLGTLDLPAESMCCQDFCTTENEQHNDQGDDGCTEMCNPFLSCACCIGFTAPLLINPLKPFSPFTEENSKHQQSISLQYIHSIWHPPMA
jgi:hypothetical protein